MQHPSDSVTYMTYTLCPIITRLHRLLVSIAADSQYTKPNTPKRRLLACTDFSRANRGARLGILTLGVAQGSCERGEHPRFHARVDGRLQQVSPEEAPEKAVRKGEIIARTRRNPGEKLCEKAKL